MHWFSNFGALQASLHFPYKHSSNHGAPQAFPTPCCHPPIIQVPPPLHQWQPLVDNLSNISKL